MKVRSVGQGYGVLRLRHASTSSTRLLQTWKIGGKVGSRALVHPTIGQMISMLPHKIAIASSNSLRSYEIGTNPLFDDRTQEVIIHDSLLRSQLPKQEPDRVYGLQETNNFEKLLSSPVPRALTNDDDITLRDFVKSSPFKDGVEPLLFPFLILEAKSGKSSSGFYEIQTQTAFPIFALLKLQEDLLAQVRKVGTAGGGGGGAVKPLIWFLANRGDAWRVYGCCLSESEPTRYVCILSDSFCH
jgi:hypothetical protein